MFERWAEEAWKVGCGALGLDVETFEAMTPAEYEWRLSGMEQAERRALLRTAQLACWVMNPWMGNKPMSVGDLVALRPEEQPAIDWKRYADK